MNVNFKNTFFKNASYLSLIQASNYIIPMLTIPYLMRVIGIENYGKVLLAQTLIIFLSALTDFGYSVAAVREMSIFKDDHKKVSKYYSTVINAKFLLLAVAIILSLAFSLVYTNLSNELLLVMFSLPFLLGNTFLPYWYYIAKGKFGQLTIITFVSKIIYLVLVFILVTKPSEYVYVNLYMGIGSIVGVVISIYIIHIKDKVRFVLRPLAVLLLDIRSNLSLFASNFSIIMYQNSNLLILGMYGTKLHIGNYGSVEKIIYAEKQVLNVYSQLIFPKISYLTSISHAQITKFLKQTFKLFFPAIISICLINFFFADTIIDLAGGKEANNDMKFIFRLLSFLPLIVALNVPFYQNLLAYNKKKQTGITLIICTIIGVTLNLALSKIYFATGTVIALTVTELMVSAGFIYLNEFKYKEISILRKND